MFFPPIQLSSKEPKGASWSVQTPKTSLEDLGPFSTACRPVGGKTWQPSRPCSPFTLRIFWSQRTVNCTCRERILSGISERLFNPHAGAFGSLRVWVCPTAPRPNRTPSPLVLEKICEAWFQGVVIRVSQLVHPWPKHTGSIHTTFPLWKNAWQWKWWTFFIWEVKAASSHKSWCPYLPIAFLENQYTAPVSSPKLTPRSPKCLWY